MGESKLISRETGLYNAGNTAISSLSSTVFSLNGLNSILLDLDFLFKLMQ